MFGPYGRQENDNSKDQATLKLGEGGFGVKWNVVNVVSCYEFSWFIFREFSFEIHKCIGEIEIILPEKIGSHFVFSFLCDEKVDIYQAFGKVWRDLFFHQMIRRRQRWINQTKCRMPSKRLGEIVTFAVMAQWKTTGNCKTMFELWLLRDATTFINRLVVKCSCSKYMHIHSTSQLTAPCKYLNVSEST